MVKKKKPELLSKLRKVFKTEDSRFYLSVGLKVSGISFGITVFVYCFVIEIIRVNYAFFKSHGFPEFDDPSLFFNVVTDEALDNIPILLAFHIFLFFIGVYLGWLILRPFRTLGEYSEKAIDNVNAIYVVEQFNAYSLLTRFSEHFFNFLRESRKKNEMISKSVPPQYLGIHKPVFDRVFMLHFGILLVIICLSVGIFIIENTSAVYSTMVELALSTLSNQKSVTRYMMAQSFIVDDIAILTVTLIVISYTALALHLYTKVSGAAFGIFSTMRSFMKGNYSSRVHLLGFSYLREYTRKINKYLDYIQNNFAKDTTKK